MNSCETNCIVYINFWLIKNGAFVGGIFYNLKLISWVQINLYLTDSFIDMKLVWIINLLDLYNSLLIFYFRIF